MKRHIAGLLLMGVIVGAAADRVCAGALAQERFLSPTIPDGVNDSAVFGASAQEVTIYNWAGRRVYRGTRAGAGAITWNCRDEIGNIVASGLYFAKIRQDDGATLYQTFAVAK